MIDHLLHISIIFIVEIKVLDVVSVSRQSDTLIDTLMSDFTRVIISVSEVKFQLIFYQNITAQYTILKYLIYFWDDNWKSNNHNYTGLRSMERHTFSCIRRQ